MWPTDVAGAPSGGLEGGGGSGSSVSLWVQRHFGVCGGGGGATRTATEATANQPRPAGVPAAAHLRTPLSGAGRAKCQVPGVAHRGSQLSPPPGTSTHAVAARVSWRRARFPAGAPPHAGLNRGVAPYSYVGCGVSGRDKVSTFGA
jgi:hypothetical protein